MAGNPNYDTLLLTSTLENFLEKQPQDAIFEDMVLYGWLNAKGRVKRREVGGTKLIVPLMYGKSTAVGSYRGYDELDVSPQEGFTNAEYTWKQYYGTISISGEEEQINAGESAMFNMLDAKWEQLRMSMRDLMNEDFYGDGTGNNSKDVLGLAILVDSAGTVGNILRSSNSWWAAQETAVGGPLAIHGSGGMLRMYNDCALGRSKMTPDAIVTTQEVYEAYEEMLGPQLRYTTTGEGNAVFSNDNLKFRKAPMFWDEECPTGLMYFLQSRVMSLIVREGRDFSNTPFKIPANQDAKVAQVLWMGELVTQNARHTGKLTGITT